MVNKKKNTNGRDDANRHRSTAVKVLHT